MADHRCPRSHDGVKPIAGHQDLGCSYALVVVQLKAAAVFVVGEGIHSDGVAHGRSAVVVPCRHDDILTGEGRRISVKTGPVEVEDALVRIAEIGLHPWRTAADIGANTFGFGQ